MKRHGGVERMRSITFFMRFHSGARGASFAANGLRFFRHATLSFFISVCAHSARPSEIGEIAEIAVDVGHTPEAFGAISARGVREFDLNRELAAKTIRALEKLKLKTRRINFDGRVGGIDARPKQAAGANFFLSIHHDSVQPELLEEWEWKGEKRTYSDRHAGFSLFVSRNNPDPVTSLRCASAIGARLRRNGFVPATHHADSIAGTPRPWADRTNAVHFYDTLIVLYRTMLPAVLLEAGVIKHRAEEMALRDPRQQTLMADALATGIAACLYVRAAPER